MFEAWGRALYRRRRLTLIVSLLLVAFAGVWGTGVFSKLSTGNSFTPPGSQSQHEQDRADQLFGRAEADVVVLYTSKTRTVSDTVYQRAVGGALATLPHNDVARITTYWSTGHNPALVSKDGHQTYAVLQLTGKDDQARQDAYKAIKNQFGLNVNGITARVGGQVPTSVAIGNEVTANIGKAEG